MRLVAIRSVEQQAGFLLHRTRDLLVRQRTMLVNALREHMAELGSVASQGIGGSAASAISSRHCQGAGFPENPHA